MSDAIAEVLLGRQANHLLPFLWLCGEEEATIRTEMARIDAAGMKAVCVESRPHPDFCGPRWWRDLDAIMDEARRRRMRVWVLDDDHFPTGSARGWIRDRHPQHRKLLLVQRHVDVVGPVAGSSILLGSGDARRSVLVGADERLVAVIASRRGDGQVVDDTLHDLSGRVADGRLWWDIPEGRWRVFVLVETRKGGVLPDCLNPIDPAACRILIDAVYEPHLERYRADFGATFAGFFSDEHSLANSGRYDELIGRAATALPWRTDMLELLAAAVGGDAARLLPGLWCDIGPRTWEIRHAFMDLVSRLYGEAFGDQIGDWCRRHGVEHIGHVIEDDNAHARLGGGTAHFFRSLRGQDMSGADVVLWQIKPGQDGQHFAWIAGEADGEFYHYGLAKMAASLGHLDPRKRGRTMCEIMGAYGWSAGLRLMTWITDHMLVRGVNVFVPHAFSMRPFPDEDCPPHFHAHGRNPQFRHFRVWSDYANRMCHLLSGGTHVASAAVLYHAEAEWSGDCMLFQKPVRELLQHQIDCDVVPVDMLSQATVEAGRLRILNERFDCLVVPYAQRLPSAALAVIHRLLEAGLPVVFVDAPPEAASQAIDAAPLLAAIAGSPRCSVVPLAGLADLLRGRGHCEVRTSSHEPALRTYHYRGADGTDLLMLFNEHPTRVIASGLTVAIAGPVCSYDAFANRLVRRPHASATGGTQLQVRLLPGASEVLVFGKSSPAGAVTVAAGRVIPGPWRVATATAEQHPEFRPWRFLDHLENIGGRDALPDFSGTIRYQTMFAWDGSMSALLDLGEVHETAEVTLNGTVLPARIAPPYTIDVSGLLRSGENHLVIDVTNTLVNQQRDWLSQYHQIGPSGLLGPVVLHPTEISA